MNAGSGRCSDDPDQDGLRARLRLAISVAREDADQETVALPDCGGPPVPAAVLVPFVFAPVPSILLTKRAATLAKHAGQVSFPGGRIDPSDDSAEFAALREAQEEIGLDPSLVEVAGRLPDLVTGTGFRVTPVLGLLPPWRDLDALHLTMSPQEVEAVFTLPLAVLLDPDAPRLQRGEMRGHWRDFWVWPHPEHYIWGATATILVELARRLRAAR